MEEVPVWHVSFSEHILFSLLDSVTEFLGSLLGFSSDRNFQNQHRWQEVKESGVSFYNTLIHSDNEQAQIFPTKLKKKKKKFIQEKCL